MGPKTKYHFTHTHANMSTHRDCGLLIILVDGAPHLQAPLRAINVSARTCGPIAHNTVTFKYKNENDTAIQSKFVYPINSESSVYHLSAKVGGRSIVGRVKERD